MQFKRIILTSLITLCSLPTFANIEFYGDKDALGHPVGTLVDAFGGNIKLTDNKGEKSKWNSGWNNDKIQSIKLHYVTAGTKIKLYDNPDAKTNDDWVEITVYQTVPVLIIPHLERNLTKAQTNNIYEQKFYKKNGLNGKVSRVIVNAQDYGKLSLPSKIARNIIGHQNNSSYWFDKNGMARTFNRNNKNYRFWKPDITVTTQKDVHISFKLDHIKGGSLDKHINVYMSFNHCGAITAFKTLFEGDIDSLEKSLNNKSHSTQTINCDKSTDRYQEAKNIIDKSTEGATDASAIRYVSKQVSDAVIYSLFN